MGQRGARAVFMPNKFVFPGGRVDPADAQTPLAPGPSAGLRAQLMRDSAADPGALCAAGIREVWEETGLRIAAPGPTGSYLGAGLGPNAAALRLFFRAITPPGRPRRFDARFFLCEASAVAGDAEDFSGADDELQFLRWVPLDEARGLDLPFITGIALAEVAAILADPAAARPVPFFDNTGPHSRLRQL